MLCLLWLLLLVCALNGEVLKDAEGGELMAAAFVEFGLELDPMEAQRVQEALHDVHAHHDADCHAGEDDEAHPHLKQTALS